VGSTIDHSPDESASHLAGLRMEPRRGVSSITRNAVRPSIIQLALRLDSVLWDGAAASSTPRKPIDLLSPFAMQCAAWTVAETAATVASGDFPIVQRLIRTS